MIPFLLPAATGLLLLAAFLLALAGYGLRDFSRNRIQEICDARRLESRFTEILNQYEPTLLAVEMLFSVVFFALVGTLLVHVNPESWQTEGALRWLGVAGQSAAMGLFLIGWVVVIPRTWARVSGEAFLVRTWPCLRLLRKVLTLPLRVAGKIDQLAHRMAGVPEPEAGTLPTLTQEILSVVDEGQREGLIEPQARKMIHRVMELQQEDVAAIMTPRTEMYVLPVEASLEQARGVLLEGGHSRVPVVGETTDDIIGILYAKDLLRHIDSTNGQAVSIREMVREAIYVPETTGIDTLLERMKREHVHIAIVIDEYSGVAGLVTLEDILEEIVGEITDEYDPEEEEEIHQISDTVIEADARVHVDELNERFNLDLPEDGDFETIGGFVFNQLGRVPKNREHFTWRQLRVTVLNVGKRKIHKLRIEIDRTLAATAPEDA